MQTKTTCLFYKDTYISRFRGKVLSCNKVKNSYEIILDQTAFYPEGGGQNGDQGYLNNVKVLDTYYKGENIIHLTTSPLKEGLEIEGMIDWDLRYARMQEHAGEHIISGVIHKQYGYDNVGFHMNDRFMTMDYNGQIEKDELYDLELKCNAEIYKNLPIEIDYLSSDEVANLEYRSKKELKGIIRLVKIPGVDVCACCGTHTRTTGEIGVIHFTDLIRYKGGVRISCVVGIRAVEDFLKKEKTINTLTTLLSSTTDELSLNVTTLVNREKLAQSQLISMKRQICDLSLNAPVVYETFNHINIDNLDPKTLVYLCNKMKSRYLASSLATTSSDGRTYFAMASVRFDLGLILEELRQEAGIKGGGKSDFIQGHFSMSLNNFLNILKSLLNAN